MKTLLSVDTASDSEGAGCPGRRSKSSAQGGVLPGRDHFEKGQVTTLNDGMSARVLMRM